MHFGVGLKVRHDLVHELKELDAPLLLGYLRADRACRHLQGGEKVESAVALVCALEAAHYVAAACLNITGLAFESLDTGLLVHGDHNRVLRRIHIQSDNIGRLCGKLGIGAYAPTSMALQAYAFFA